MSLFEIKVEIAVPAVEETADRLFEIGDNRWSIVEDAVALRAWLVGIFPDEPSGRARWAELEPIAQSVLRGPVATRELADADWKESYKLHFHAWKFGRLNWVPVWERDQFVLPAGEEILWLDPGMAFGTGNHETTRLVVERLAAWAPRASNEVGVIDAGCGSGILALSAARLGFRRIAAFDIDPLAVEVSRGNAALNGLAEAVGFFVADLATGLAGRSAGLVMANIQADILQLFARELCAAVEPGGLLVMSGILGRELDQVRATFSHEAVGWEIESRGLAEWADLVLTRPA